MKLKWAQLARLLNTVASESINTLKLRSVADPKAISDLKPYRCILPPVLQNDRVESARGIPSAPEKLFYFLTHLFVNKRLSILRDFISPLRDAVDVQASCIADRVSVANTSDRRTSLPIQQLRVAHDRAAYT